MNSVKLQKYFSDCAIMSRRAAEEEIEKGRVTVNGRPATLGLRIDPDADVEKGRKTVISLLCGLDKRVYPVGRLDMDSDGLLILTDDGELTNRLTHPRHQIPKIYHVTVSEHPTPEQIAILSSALVIDGYKIQPVKTKILKNEQNSAVLEMTLFEGRNRQIRKMCKIAKLTVTRLSRVALGKISLGKLEIGKWRYLTSAEIEYLKKESAPKNA